MKYLLILPIIFMNSCAGFNQVADDVEKMADNDAVIFKVEKEAINKESNVHMTVDIINQPQESPIPCSN